ncbi:MAG TPA: CPBP family intramembrane glutamic endopeptidase [Rhizomicrobium sp.]|nr:CPBP family intramembrane glutamic endopeptidase [Rhizomicrobium sp.]
MTDTAVASRPLARRVFDNRPVRVVVLFVLVTLADALVQMGSVELVKRATPEDAVWFKLGATTVSALALLFVYWLLVRMMEHRRIAELGPRKAPGGLVAGAAIGLGLFSLAIALLSVMGVAKIAPAGSAGDLLAPANMAVLSGIGEELIFRGVVFRIFEEMFGSLVALIVSAAFFGAVHLANPGATLVSGAAIALEAGLLLGVTYMAARNLWLPIGLHFGWNFAESAIFGSVVSGAAFKGLYATTLAGPDSLTGGKFGPEASVVAVAVCAAAALAMLVVAFRRGEWKGLRLAANDRG